MRLCEYHSNILKTISEEKRMIVDKLGTFSHVIVILVQFLGYY